jgi:predicted kinase
LTSSPEVLLLVSGERQPLDQRQEVMPRALWREPLRRDSPAEAVEVGAAVRRRLERIAEASQGEIDQLFPLLRAQRYRSESRCRR